MHSSDGCIWGWVRSWAINLCSPAGCHTHSLSQSFPRKQLCESLEWWGNAPPPPATAGAACPNSRATPSIHRWPPFGGILEKGGGTSKHSPRLFTPPSHARGSWSPPAFMGPPPDPLTSTPVTSHRQKNWLKGEEPYENMPFQPFLKSQLWCSLTAQQHVPAPPLSCHLLTSKGSHQDAQVYFQSNKNSANQTTTMSSYLSSDFVTQPKTHQVLRT